MEQFEKVGFHQLWEWPRQSFNTMKTWFWNTLNNVDILQVVIFLRTYHVFDSNNLEEMTHEKSAAKS